MDAQFGESAAFGADRPHDSDELG